jgi:ATPase family associated with various cellular activities (AAA)
MTMPELAITHLRLRLRPLNRALRAAVERQAAEAARLERPDLTPLYVADDQARALLDRVEAPDRPAAADPPWRPTDREVAAEAELRRQAAAAGTTLPLDVLAADLRLTPFELEAILLCAAPETDAAYERVYAYVLDDLNRRFPCVELLCGLTAASPGERLRRRRELAGFGRLRRLGLLQAVGDAPTGLRQELRLAPRALDFLLGAGGDLWALARDPDEVDVPAGVTPPVHVDSAEVERLGRALDDGQLGVVGVWGAAQDGRDETLLAVAAAAARPLRRLALPEPAPAAPETEALAVEALRAAAFLGAVLLVPTGPLNAASAEAAGDALAEALRGCRVPLVLSGEHPWRPSALLAARGYAEIEVVAPGYRERRAMWSSALPDLDGPRLDDLAARFRMGAEEMRAVASMARAEARLGNGRAGSPAAGVDAAAAAVARKRSDQFASVLTPRRSADDLVLPADLHRQVLEVAAFYRAWPRVSEGWGFGRLAGPGIRALFTGEPGTGKSLAAEVVAGVLGLALLKVDLARVVSKWVGETEKNLESAFRAAEVSHSLLLFDEADALFGRRGEVRHGTDRYANLEVGYLLQRLEEHDGLVILASNLEGNIDAAFTRRFQFIIRFPRPGLPERRRIWRLAFPPAARLADDLDLRALAELDMTGAGIVSSARTAGLLAADEGAPVITMRHAVQAVSRQYQRESRVLRHSELGPYAALL